MVSSRCRWPKRIRFPAPVAHVIMATSVCVELPCPLPSGQKGEVSMLDGVMLLWFLLAAASLLFVAIDIRTTPESPVMKWGFVLLTAYTGVIGAFLYVLGCREPLPGLHERYVAVQWREALGSTMHCVAGDGIGILAGAVLATTVGISGIAEAALEYVLGFA